MKELLEKSFEAGMSYKAYRTMTRDLIAHEKTTGPNQSEDMVRYTKLNEQRMNRLDKTIRLTEETEAFFKDLKVPLHWLVITEPWCGDAAHSVPLFNAISEIAPSIKMKLVLRDENAELMDKFEQNGSRAIPIVVNIDTRTGESLGAWGARPVPAQVFVDEYKSKDPKPPYDELVTTLQKWYNQDKSKTTQKELVDFIKSIT